MRPERLNDLFKEVQTLDGVGPKLLRPLEKLGLTRLRDLAYHLPDRFVERRAVPDLDAATVGENIIVAVTVREHRQSGGRGPFRVMAEDALIGYMPVRVWGCPTTAMWVYRLGAEKAKRMLFTGDKITGSEAKELGLVLDAVPAGELDARVDALAERMAGVPQNQLMMQKLMVNQAIEAMGMNNTQMIATLFDGITRHSPEGINFKTRAEEVGWKQAVRERDLGTWDWTQNRPINAPK